jgi:DNA-binding CsgD family transcriptional regulator
MNCGGERELTEEQLRLLDLLRQGVSVREAARRVHLSRRTAERRLAEAREVLGAATNAEAVIRSRQPKPDGREGELTDREREVVELVAAGLRDDEIAAQLGIARSTVATLLRSSMAKLGAQTRVQAAAKFAGITDVQAAELFTGRPRPSKPPPKAS